MHIKTRELILLSVLTLAFVIRIVFLDADPSILLDSGQVGDEGYWVYNARNLALFKQSAGDDFYHDFAAAPVFSFFSFLSFSLFGVGFWQARLVSSLAGFITILLTYKIAGFFGKKIAILSCTLVSFNVLLLLHNRLAVGESLSVFFLTACVFFFLRRNFVVAGITLGLSIMSKTTSFLYLPSLFLIAAFGIYNGKVRVKEVLVFPLAAISAILIISAPIFLIWGRQVSLVYSTFGSWYRPQNIQELWQNVFNFFTHPFWGSPFIFSILTVAIVNIINFFGTRGAKSYERAVLICWILGILALGPFISRLSNARLLGIVPPIAILAAQVLIGPKKFPLDIETIIRKLYRHKKIKMFLAIIIAYFPSLVLAKIALAIVKRASGNFEVVNLLPQISLLIYFAFAFFLLRFYKLFSKRLFFITIVFFISLPTLSFADVIGGYLHFFNITSALSGSVLSSFKLLVLIIFVYAFSLKKIRAASLVKGIFLSYLVFSIFGISTVILNVSYNFLKSSQYLGNYVDGNAFIGFMGHELAIENSGRPIYFAPRLERIEAVNKNFLNYRPKYLLETKVFDSRIVDNNGWPTTSDIGGYKYIDRLDLSRKFLTSERKVMIDVYQISD